MTIEFYKTKKAISRTRRDITKDAPQVRRRIKIYKVRVLDPKLARDWGTRRVTARGGSPRKGEVGYIFGPFREMKKAFKSVR